MGYLEIYLEECESTNLYAKEHLNELTHLSAVYTKNQTMGRGRRGRNWICGEGSVAISFVLHNIPPDRLPTLSLCTGIAVCNALGGGFELKWPNDILFKSKKICGILCESRGNNGDFSAVLGIGLNLFQSSEYFEENNLPNAASVKSSGRIPPSERDAIKLIRLELIKILEKYLPHGFCSIEETYGSLCVNLGKEVLIIYENKEVIGIAEKIASDGSLVINSNGKIINVNSGEASLRQPESD